MTIQTQEQLINKIREYITDENLPHQETVDAILNLIDDTFEGKHYAFDMLVELDKGMQPSFIVHNLYAQLLEGKTDLEEMLFNVRMEAGL